MCSSMELVESSDIEVKRGRGRPRKEITEVIEEAEPVIKKKGRPRKIVEDVEPGPKNPKGRPKLENPCVSGKPKAGRQYFKDYYRAKLQNCLVNCPNCNTLIEKVNRGNHMKSKLCAEVASFISVSS